MIEVGKVTTKKNRVFHPSVAFGVHDPGVIMASEWVTVEIGPESMTLTTQVGSGLPSSNQVSLKMTPTQAIELAQMMMKAAESQVEYAEAYQELKNEMTKLDESFKDRISGLGIGGIEEPKAKAPLKSVPEGVIIVEAG